MKLTIYTDGGSLNNPGEAAIAYATYLGDELIAKYAKRIGIASNNVAEYTALIEALQYAKSVIPKHNIKSIHIYSDSQLMVNQMNGLYKVKDANLGTLQMKVRVLENELDIPIAYTHVLRDKNTLADSLVKKVLFPAPSTTLEYEPA
jgi:ribonuclease HI